MFWNKVIKKQFKFLKDIENRTVFWFSTTLLVSIFGFWSLLRPGFFFMQDDMQAMRILQMHKCVLDLQIPCRWVPDMGYGYGYPAFHYYAPLPYYVGEVFNLFGLSIIDSVKAVFVATFLGSAIFMFLFGRSLWGNIGGFVSAVFYTFAPYRAVDAYVRGALGELTGLVFLPLIFWAMLQTAKTGKKIYILYLALGYAGLLIGHNLLAFFFTPVILLWFVFLIVFFGKMNFVKLVIGLLWGFSLSAFFTIPLIFEKKFAHTETLLYGYFNYLAHFVSIKQLFVSRHWGFGSSELGPNDDLSFSLGYPHWIVAVATFVIAMVGWRKYRKQTFILGFLFFLFLGSAFLTHQRSSIIWQHIPVLAYLQFPWRFLTFAIFASSATAGFLVWLIQARFAKTLIAFVLVAATLFLNVGFFQPKDWFPLTDEEKFSGQLWEKQLTISIFDYLPIYATLPPANRAPELPQTITGDVSYLVYQKGTDWQILKVLVKSSTADIRLPLFDFPGWQVKVDGRVAQINHNNFLGLITFTVSGGEHTVDVRLKNTLPRTVGNIVTLTGILLIVGMLYSLYKPWGKLGLFKKR